MNRPATRVQIHSTTSTPREVLRFAFDEQVIVQDATGRLRLSGWVLHRESRVAEVRLRKGSTVLAGAAPDIHRPRASELFASFPGAELAGFRLELPSPGEGIYRLEIRLEDGRSLALAELRLVAWSQRRLLFMHIPKAAGSTVNNFLQMHFRRSACAIHIEADPRWHEEIDRIRNLDFVSGHIPLPALAAKLNLDDYFKVTAVRDPFAQAVSHLAWIRKLADESELHRFNSHPEYVQDFARKLKSVDLSRPRMLRRLIASLNESEARLMDNCQTRYFVKIAPGERVTDERLSEAQTASRIFDRIGRTGHISELLEGIAEVMNWPEPGRLITANVAQSYYGLDARRSRIRNALEPLVRHDLEMVRYIRNSRDRTGCLKHGT